jgi:hypothetical protein
MNQEATTSTIQRPLLWGRWLFCTLPPAVFVVVEETPGLSGLDGINAAALIVMSPVFIALGFGLTAAVVALTRWVSRKLEMRSRLGSALIMLIIVGVLSPMEYLEGDWLLLGVIEIASLPAAIFLASARSQRGETP